MDNLEQLYDDVVLLIENSEEDFNKQQYAAYENYIREYNRILGECKVLGLFQELKSIEFVPERNKPMYGGVGTVDEIAKHREIVNESKKLLNRIKRKIGTEQGIINSLDTLHLIFSRFHGVVRQLRNRYSNRNTLDVNDEYDVQDLLHSLLRLYFDDIRAEEWTPSYAGGCKRMDFLLKNEKIVIEVKKTRQGLTDKEVGEQLLIDIGVYKQHSDCSTLICFVYDPEGRIGNPVGIENDLNSQSRDGLIVKTHIFPK